MYFALYVLYALVQGILVARYVLEEKDYPTMMVVLCAIFAPFVSFGLALAGIEYAIRWLVTHGK